MSLEKQRVPVTFASVAKEAGVGRSFLYNNDAIRTQIEALREETAGIKPKGTPAAESASQDSLRARLRSTLEENQRLRLELSEMREELAHALGRAREAEARRNSKSTEASRSKE